MLLSQVLRKGKKLRCVVGLCGLDRRSELACVLVPDVLVPVVLNPVWGGIQQIFHLARPALMVTRGRVGGQLESDSQAKNTSSLSCQPLGIGWPAPSSLARQPPPPFLSA